MRIEKVERRHWWLFVAIVAIVANLVLVLFPTQPDTKVALLHLYALQPQLPGRLVGMPLPEFSKRLHVDADDLQHYAALADLTDHNWPAAISLLKQQLETSPQNGQVLNDLGVAYLGLASSDPAALFDAVRQFRMAEATSVAPPEAHFNLWLAYLRLGLFQQASLSLQKYQSMDRSRRWESQRERFLPDSNPDTEIPDIFNMSAQEIEKFTTQRPGIARAIGLEFANTSTDARANPFNQIATVLSSRFGDATLLQALKAFDEPHLSEIHQVRTLIVEGRDLYLKGRVPESREKYKHARLLLARRDSPFDEVVLGIYDGDALSRLLDLKNAVEILRPAIQSAHRNDMKLLEADALSSLSSAGAISDNFQETLGDLERARQLYESIGERKQLARTLNYLATFNSLDGAYDDSLRFAVRAVQVADPADSLRLSQLESTIGDVLLAKGDRDLAILFVQEGADRAQQTKNPLVISFMNAQLAAMYVWNHDEVAAARHLEIADAARKQSAANDMHTVGELSAAELSANVTRARLALSRRNIQEVEADLAPNISYFEHHYVHFGTHVHAQSRLLLAKAFEISHRDQEAEEQYRKAIQVAEDDQMYLANEKLQVDFDAQRREMYDSAVRFSQERSGCEQSWELMQGYRAKLFNALFTHGKFNESSAARVTLRAAQQRLTDGAHVIEYALTDDELIIWSISPKTFSCRAVPEKRVDVERDVREFSRLMMNRQNAESLAVSLYNRLVRPIENLILPNETVVIVPDGILYQLPFAALRAASDRLYWIEKVPLLQTPSLKYFLSGATAQKPGQSRRMALGTAEFTSELVQLKSFDADLEVLNGRDLNKQKFLAESAATNLIYYAGHSAFDQQNALQSRILLDGNAEGENTIWAYELLNHRLFKHPVVLLSSCETALGNHQDGAGLRGLTSAFLLAGSRAVVGTLWATESKSSGELMKDVYRRIVFEETPIATALQDSQKQAIHTGIHPYYWSGFVVTGNSQLTSN